MNSFSVLEGEDAEGWETVARKVRKATAAGPPAVDPKEAARAERERLRAAAAGLKEQLKAGTAGRAASGARPAGNVGTMQAARPGASGAGPSHAAAREPVEEVPKPRTHGPDGKPLSDNYYRAFQRVFVNAAGEAVMRFHKTDIVRIKPNGDIVLNTGTWFTGTTKMSMNDALQHVGVEVISRGKGSSDDWYVVDSDGQHPFQDNMVVPPRTAADKTRAQAMLQAFGMGPRAAAAASSSSSVRSNQLGAGPSGSTLSTAASAPAPRTAGPPRMIPGSTCAELYASRQQQQQAAAAAAAVSSCGPPQVASAPPGPAQFAAKSSTLTAEHFEHVLNLIRAPSGGLGNGTGAATTLGSHVGNGGAAAPSGLPFGAALGGAAAAAGNSGGAGAHGAGAHTDDDYCVVCFEQLRNTICIPCGHLILCKGCAEDVKGAGGMCPICRGTITELLVMED